MSDALKRIVDKYNQLSTAKKVPATVFLYAVVRVAAAWLLRKLRNRPPQPFTLPLVGNLYLLSQPGELPGVHKDMMRLAEKHGPVMGFWFGGVYTVVLSNWQAMYEALKVRGDDFAGRFCPPAINTITKGRGIALQNDMNIWHKARSLAQAGLLRKDVTGDEVVGVILEEVHSTGHEWLQKIEESPSKTAWECPNIRFWMEKESLNVYMRQMCSIRFSDKLTPKYASVRQCFQEIFQRISCGNPADYISILRLAGKPKILTEMEEWSDKMYGHIREWIREHQATLKPEAPRDFLDCMLLKYKELGLSEVDVEVVVWDTLAGGIDTTAATMEWLYYILCNNPETGMRAQEELDRVIGPDRLPTWKDRPNLPYLNAVMLELMRYKHFAPFGLPHMTQCDTTCLGYNIPAGAQVMINFGAANLDKNAWKEPLKWRPERFLEEEKDLAMSGPNGIHDALFGDIKPTPESHKYIPFGAGKRKCVGVAIGRVVLWLKVATHLHCFNFESATGKPVNTDDEYFGVTLTPVKAPLKISARPAARFLKSCEHTYTGKTI